MGKQTSRYGWRWALPAIGVLAWLSLGCNPQSLSMLLLPFDSKTIEPEYKLFTSSDEVKLVVLVSFDHFERTPAKPEVAPVEIELGDKLTRYIHERCGQNRHRVNIVAQSKVRSYVLKQRADGDFAPDEIGRHFKADYTIDVNIRSCSLYAKSTQPPQYRGMADIDLTIYKTSGKRGDVKVFSKTHHAVDPSEDYGVPADSMNVAAYRDRFMTILARDLSKIFIAFPQQERHQLDFIADVR